MSAYTIVSFLKFGSERNMKDLFENGTIYMNSIQYFKDLEDSGLRGDQFEGVSRIKNYPPGEIQIPEINFKTPYVSLHVRESYNQVVGNIYSLYCVSSKGWDKPQDCMIDKKNMGFGSHCVLIKDCQSFFSLITCKLDKLSLDYTHGFVRYYNKYDIERKLTVFEKPMEFEFQKEFRFYVKRFSTQPLKIQIGSLQQIAELLPAEGVIETFRLKKNKTATD